MRRRRSLWVAVAAVVLATAGCGPSDPTVLDAGAKYAAAPGDGTYADVAACKAEFEPGDLPPGFARQRVAPPDCDQPGLTMVHYADPERSGRKSLDLIVEVSPTAEAARAAFPATSAKFAQLHEAETTEQPPGPLAKLGDQVRYYTSTGDGPRHVNVIAIGKGAAVVVLAVVTDLQFTVEDLSRLAGAALKQVARIH